MRSQNQTECRAHVPIDVRSPRTPLFFRNWLLNQKLSRVFAFPNDPSAPVAHMRRVGQLSGLLSETLDPNQKKINQLVGLKHDIGKALIPNAVEVLTYSGKLSVDHPDWWREVLKHPIYSVDLLLAYTPEIALLIAEEVRHHHEKEDGSGYPDGLQADEIPFGASIVTVADTFDAMTVGGNFRSYGQPVTPEASIDFMLTGNKYPRAVVTQLRNLTKERSGSRRLAKIYQGTT